MMDYDSFLRAKMAEAPTYGVPVQTGAVNPALKPHQAAIVEWMVTGGRRACFAAFGLGKSVIQLEAMRLTLAEAGGRGLIVCPLSVRNEFRRDSAQILGWDTPPRFIRSIHEADDEGIYLTNYETVRDGKLDPRAFNVASLDEASILRGFGGTKTFREFMRLFAGQAGPRAKIIGGVPYRYVATATPSPNDYIELLAYAAYLDVMDVSAAKTRFFKRDSTKADKLTLHPHKVDEFWLWVSSWAIFVQRPSDMGFDDTGYALPELDIRWHEVPTDHSLAGADRNGQGRLFKNAALGVVDASREKRSSLPARLDKLMELRAEAPGEHRILWHDLEDERRALEQAIPSVVSVYGAQDMDLREQAIADFSDGKIAELAAKPVIAGSGCNFQRYCSRAIYLGIGFKFNDFIQSVHRINRFLQTKPVRIDMIYTEAEREVRRVLEDKWTKHTAMVDAMTALIREHGLAHPGLAAKEMERAMTVERKEIVGENYKLIHGDSIEEVRGIESDSVGLIVTSIPFSTQYEYTPSYRDLGHTDNDDHFFSHLGYLTPELLRVLKPGRIAAVHVKDRIVPGGLTGLGFQTVNPFSDHTIRHFQEHGFAFLGRKTVVTDVVRENNQTYRLGWTEQCKDGTKMGAGMPEYVLLFRKPPTDSADGYADEPVVKDKAEYTRTRWQIDAHGFMRSDGNRPLTPADLEGLSHPGIFQLFREHGLNNVYSFEDHVTLGEYLEQKGALPVTFMLLQPPSWHPDVWTDITRMRTLNMLQERKGLQMHLCPLQFDIVDRLITQMSNPGDVVLDPFGGLMTVPYCALKLRRRAIGIELNPGYFMDGAAYCAAVEREMSMPTLFDLDALESADRRIA